MKVFKFGGASVKNADAVRNVGVILKKYLPQNLLVVVSAMGKTTNALEQVLNAWYGYDNKLKEYFEPVVKFHSEIISELFPDKTHRVYSDVDKLFLDLGHYLEGAPSQNYDFEYDQVVSYGELISTVIVSHYLFCIGIDNRLFDVREYIKTNTTFRDAEVDWQMTSELIAGRFNDFFSKEDGKIAITQGFIGSTAEGNTTTLGREGSDYTAAIFAHILDAEDMTIWKDVPGLLNADPKYFPDAQKLDRIPYREAIELSYYGATIIHPKTIKPLENKSIPLNVKSFLNPDSEGSVIASETGKEAYLPSYIFKRNQSLVTITPRDFSFIDERNLSFIFGVFARHHVKINLMQNSAISFSVCIDHREDKMTSLIRDLQEAYHVKYNCCLDLITIRHYNHQTIDTLLEHRELLLEQKSRITAQLIVK